MKGFVAVPTKDIPIQAGNSLAYNPAAFFDVRNEKFKNASGDVKSMNLFIHALFVLGVVLIIKNK